MKKILLSVTTLFVATMTNAQTALPYSNSLLSDNGDFTQSTEYASEADKEAVPEIWHFDARYGAKASAYVNQVYYGVTSMLSSPVFDVEGSKDLTLSFEHAGKFFTNPSTEATLLVKAVSADGNESTEQVVIPTYFTNSDWNFVSNSISLAQYDGFKTLQVLFVYKSSTEAAGTWEIRNFSLQNAEVTPAPPAPATPDSSASKLAAQFDFTNPTPDYKTMPEFTAWSTNIVGESDRGNITQIEKNGVKVAFPEGSASTHARLWKATSTYDLRLYTNQLIQVKTGIEKIAGVIFYADYKGNINIREKTSGVALAETASATARQRAVMSAKFMAAWTADPEKSKQRQTSPLRKPQNLRVLKCSRSTKRLA